MLLQLNLQSETPIYLQIRNEIVRGIGEGLLEENEPLPSVRQLARDLSIDKMTVNKAYQLLKEEGFIQIDPRAGTRIKKIAPPDENTLTDLAASLKPILLSAKAKGISWPTFINLSSQIFCKGEYK